MRQLRVGLIGAGFAARFHVHCYRRVAGIDVQLRGVAAGQFERAQGFADELHVKAAHPNVESLLADPEIDLIDICAPNNVHVPLIELAAAAGKHVAVEKPLTGYFGDDWPDPAAKIGDVVPRDQMRRGALANADRAILSCARAGVKLLYAENWVYAPGIQKVRRLLD